jgi:hypothetical protein
MIQTEDDDGVGPILEWEYVDALQKASEAIQSHPQLASVKRLRIQDLCTPLDPDQLRGAARVIGRLFKSMGPLEKLVLDASDLQPYLAPFVDLPEFYGLEKSYVYPRIRDLTILHREEPLDKDSGDAIVEFAKAQHAKGVPFRSVVFRSEEFAPDIAERLQLWVRGVHLHQEMAEADGRNSMQS